MKPILFRASLSLACLPAVPQVHTQADTTSTVESSASTDNGVMGRKCIGKNPTNTNYTDGNVSPPPHWPSVLTGTNSLVLIVSDPQDAGGLGVNHWMTCDIPIMQMSLLEGTGTGPALRMGQNSIGKPAYLGPCPSKGTGIYCCAFLLIATDLAPNVLPNGLARAELDIAIKEYSKNAAAQISRFGSF